MFYLNDLNSTEVITNTKGAGADLKPQGLYHLVR